MTEHAPIESPVPHWPAENDVFADFADNGWIVIDRAIAQAANGGTPLVEGISTALYPGILPFLDDLTDAEQHALFGFLWGVSVRLSRLLESPPTTTNDSTNGDLA